MKKLMVIATMGLILLSGSMFAQTATSDKADAKDKTESIKTKPVKQGTSAGVQHSNSTATKAKLQANPGKKQAVKAPRSKTDAKSNSTQKEHVREHKDEIKAKTDSKAEAKAKLQRKHDKHKSE